MVYCGGLRSWDHYPRRAFRALANGVAEFVKAVTITNIPNYPLRRVGCPRLDVHTDHVPSGRQQTDGPSAFAAAQIDSERFHVTPSVIWNSTITKSLVDRFGDGLTGHFRVPGEFGQRVAVTKDNTTLYASDRDMFIFLADEDRRIEIANRRDGKPGSLARGFFVWNSEVGSSTFGIALFLFDYVCCNRIVWGAQDYKEIRIRHTSSAVDRWIEEVAPAINAYAESSTATVEHAIQAAQSKKIDDVDAFLKTRFSATQASSIKAAHMADEQRPIETLWDAATGITAYARSVQYQDAWSARPAKC